MPQFKDRRTGSVKNLPHSNEIEQPRYVHTETDGGHVVWDRKDKKVVKSFSRTPGSNSTGGGKKPIRDESSLQARTAADKLNEKGETVRTRIDRGWKD